MHTKKSVRSPSHRTKTNTSARPRRTGTTRRSKAKHSAVKKLAQRRIFGLRLHHIGGISVLLFGMVWGLVASGLMPGTGHAASCTVSATLVSSCRPWLGAYAGSYSEAAADFKSQILYHEQQIGRPLDVVHDYRPPGNNTLTSADTYFATRANTILALNWKPATLWNDAAGGNSATNAAIDQMANSIKTVAPNKILLSVFHEPENDVSAGGSPTCGSSITYKGSSGTTTDYTNMWHNVRNRFNAAGVTNVVWVMNYMGFSNWNCMIKDLWPGNNYVDWVTWDPYLQTNSATFNATISTFYNFLSSSSDGSHDFNAKPWGLNEWGIDTGVDQAHTYADYDAAKAALDAGTFPNLKLYDIFDTINPTDFRIAYNGASARDATELSHYAAFANDSHFSNPVTPTPDPTPNPTPTPSDTTAPTVSITSPAQSAQVSGIITIAGNASDNVGVSSVTLRIDNVYIATDTTSPYSFSIDTTKYGNGTHSLVLRAFDAANNMGQSTTIAVTVSNATSSGGTTGGSGSTSSGGTTVISVDTTSGHAATPVAVKGTLVVVPTSPSDSVSLQVDGQSQAGNSVDTTKLTNGTHTLTIHEGGKTVQRTISVHNPWPKAVVNTINAHKTAYVTSSLSTLLLLVAAAVWILRFHPLHRKRGSLLMQFGANPLIKPRR